MEQADRMARQADMTYKSEAQKRHRIGGDHTMPYVVMGTNASTRTAGPEFTNEFYFAFYAPMARGAPLTSDLLALKPDPYYVRAPRAGDMPEIFGENLGVWTIGENVKNIIEELESGVHTFIPVNLRVRGKDKDFGQYYLLYIGQAIDAVVIDETDFRDGHGRVGFEKSWVLGAGDSTLDGQRILGRHLWRGGFGRVLPEKSDPFYRYCFCSDELKKALKAAKVDGWRFRECKLSKTKK